MGLDPGFNVVVPVAPGREGDLSGKGKIGLRLACLSCHRVNIEFLFFWGLLLAATQSAVLAREQLIKIISSFSSLLVSQPQCVCVCDKSKMVFWHGSLH